MNNINLLEKRIGIGSIPANLNVKQKQNVKHEAGNFDTLLVNSLLDKYGISFSKHSSIRMNERKIEMNPEQVQRLGKAIDTAKRKNVREALILLDNTAMVVDIPSKVIVTVADKANLKDKVFTNIDGAIIA